MSPKLCLVYKKCNIGDNVSKIKDNTDRPEKKKSAVIRNHFGAQFFLICTVFLR